MNKVIIITTILVALIALCVGIKEPNAKIYNPTTYTIESKDLQSAYLSDLDNENEIIIPVKMPTEGKNQEDSKEVEVPPVSIEPFGFLDQNSNIFNRPILAGYYLNNSQNAERAANLIHGSVIQPGESFSFNDVVGERTVERGFSEGRVIVGNRYERGIGGGICRTSTALYQTAKRADLQIDEVHQHTLPVGYAYRGQDAAVAWKELDLKITNTMELPVEIIATTSNHVLYLALVN